MRFKRGETIVYSGEAWSVIDTDESAGQYQVRSLDGTSVGWVNESEVLRAP